MRKNVVIILLIVLIVTLGGACVYFYTSNKDKDDTNSTNESGNNVSNTDNANNAINNDTVGNQANNTSAELSIQSAKDIYNKAYSIYWYMDFNISSNTIEVYCDKENAKVPCNEILNYNEIMEPIFSNKGKQQYLENSLVFESNSKIYKIDADRGSDVYYISTELIQETFNDNRIEYIAKSKYVNQNEHFEGSGDEYTGNNFEYEENSFVLVKENGKWLVGDFTLPN